VATIIKKCSCEKQGSCKHNWVVRYRDGNGKQRERTFLHNQKTIAGHFSSDVEQAKRLGEYVDPKQAAIKFADAAADWVSKRRALSTRTTYQGLLDKHINPVIGQMTISAVASARGRDIVETLLTETLPAADLGISRIKAAYQVINGVINDAIRKGKLTKSNLAGIKLDHIEPRHRNGHSDFVFPSHQQLATMAAKMPADYRLAIWLMRGCGLRIGEALGVSVADFMPGGVLRVRGQLLAKNKTYGPLKARKPGEYRDVPVPAYVAQIVAQHQAQPDGHLFAPIWHTAFADWFNKARDTAGIDGAFTPHSLRHVFASVALSNSIPISDVSKWLGHRDINMTYAIYGHLVPSSFDRAKNVLDAEYEAWSSEVA
jgi:integrase